MITFYQELLHCYYQGYLRGIKGSNVVVSTCNGLKYFFNFCVPCYLKIEHRLGGSFF